MNINIFYIKTVFKEPNTIENLFLDKYCGKINKILGNNDLEILKEINLNIWNKDFDKLKIIFNEISKQWNNSLYYNILNNLFENHITYEWKEVNNIVQKWFLLDVKDRIDELRKNNIQNNVFFKDSELKTIFSKVNRFSYNLFLDNKEIFWLEYGDLAIFSWESKYHPVYERNKFLFIQESIEPEDLPSEWLTKHFFNLVDKYKLNFETLSWDNKIDFYKECIWIFHKINLAYEWKEENDFIITNGYKVDRDYDKLNEILLWNFEEVLYLDWWGFRINIDYINKNFIIVDWIFGDKNSEYNTPKIKTLNKLWLKLK